MWLVISVLSDNNKQLLNGSFLMPYNSNTYTNIMEHINNHYLKVDDIELRQILEETTNEELKVRIKELLGMADDPLTAFHNTIAYYNQ